MFNSDIIPKDPDVIKKLPISVLINNDAVKSFVPAEIMNDLRNYGDRTVGELPFSFWRTLLIALVTKKGNASSGVLEDEIIQCPCCLHRFFIEKD